MTEADEAASAVAVEVVEASAADAEVTEVAVEVVEASAVEEVVEEVADVEESALAQKSLLSPTFVSLAFTFNAAKMMSY